MLVSGVDVVRLSNACCSFFLSARLSALGWGGGGSFVGRSSRHDYFS